MNNEFNSNTTGPSAGQPQYPGQPNNPQFIPNPYVQAAVQPNIPAGLHMQANAVNNNSPPPNRLTESTVLSSFTKYTIYPQAQDKHIF